MRLNGILDMLVVGQKNQDKIHRLDLATTEIFLFTRLALNLKGSQVNRLIEAIPEKKNIGPEASVTISGIEKTSFLDAKTED